LYVAYTLMTRPLLQTYTPFPFPLVQGERDRVLDTEGRYYFDFYGAHCVCSTGHAHPHVAAAIARQAKKLLFYSTAAEIPVRHEAAEALIRFANSWEGSDLASVFFCNTGSEANENALKLAVKITGRYRFAAFDGGWHGRGMLPLSVTDDPKLSKVYAPFLVPCTRLKWNDEAQLDAFDFSQVAAVILEPIQSMAGIRVATLSFLTKLREVTAAAGALLILDEVQTGMGRLGQPYAAGKYRVRPDLLTTAKGLASGVPMGALLMTAEIADSLKPGDLGSTFGGSPLACAALLATLDVIQEERLMARAVSAEAKIRRSLTGSCVAEVLGSGLLLGLRVPSRASELKQHLEQKGILVGSSADPEVLRLMPPLNLTDEAIAALANAVREF
jgi:acetylornithine/succinyldiaminopimelate/putrescine aminotransferase